MAGQTYDHERVSFNTATLKKGTETFEVVVDSDKAMDYKHGKDVDIRDVLKDENIFSDAKKGLLASSHRLEQVFKTSDVLEVAKVIIETGKIQLTADYRAKVAEEKKKKLIDMIHRNGVDPRTHLPHPPVRIENAMEEVKLKIDQNKSAEDQLQDVIKQLRAVLPIKFEVKEIAVKVPPEYGAKSYPIVKNFGKILRDDWQTDGSWICVVELPAGLEQDFYEKLNSLTHGNVETKMLNVK